MHFFARAIRQKAYALLFSQLARYAAVSQAVFARPRHRSTGNRRRRLAGKEPGLSRKESIFPHRSVGARRRDCPLATGSPISVSLSPGLDEGVSTDLSSRALA